MKTSRSGLTHNKKYKWKKFMLICFMKYLIFNAMFFFQKEKQYNVLICLVKDYCIKHHLLSHWFLKENFEENFGQSMSIINSVRGCIYIVGLHRAQYLAHSSSIFSSTTFSFSWLFEICVTKLMTMLYMRITEIFTKFKNIVSYDNYLILNPRKCEFRSFGKNKWKLGIYLSWNPTLKNCVSTSTNM